LPKSVEKDCLVSGNARSHCKQHTYAYTSYCYEELLSADATRQRSTCFEQANAMERTRTLGVVANAIGQILLQAVAVTNACTAFAQSDSSAAAGKWWRTALEIQLFLSSLLQGRESQFQQLLEILSRRPLLAPASTRTSIENWHGFLQMQNRAQYQSSRFRLSRSRSGAMTVSDPKNRISGSDAGAARLNSMYNEHALPA
jgi:hypothetical protein